MMKLTLMSFDIPSHNVLYFVIFVVPIYHSYIRFSFILSCQSDFFPLVFIALVFNSTAVFS